MSLTRWVPGALGASALASRFGEGWAAWSGRVVFGRKDPLGLARRPPERMRRATRFSMQERPRLFSSRVILGLP